MKWVLATQNNNKQREFEQIFNKQLEFITLGEAGIFDELPENENTIEGNSLSKAKAAYTLSGLPCIAEDTGLEVEALGGAPGVHSARYAGIGARSEENIAKLLEEMKAINNRKARFKTVITYIDQDHMKQFEGICTGKIALNCSGSNGFGYDCVFIPDGYKITFAEMTASEKNACSHRKKAIVILMSFCKEIGII